MRVTSTLRVHITTLSPVTCWGSRCCSELQGNGNVDTLKIQPQLFTAFTLAGRCAGLDTLLLAQSLEQSLGATEQKVTDAVSNVRALKCSSPQDQLRVIDATRECGLELAGRWVFFPFYQLKQQATLLGSLLAISWLQ